jgi:hypothetical protein
MELNSAAKTPPRAAGNALEYRIIIYLKNRRFSAACRGELQLCFGEIFVSNIY